MKALTDSRFAFASDADLYDLVGRLILKRVHDEAFAEDIRQGAYEVAFQLVLRGHGPRPGSARGWMCHVSKIHTFAELRRKKREPQPLASDEEPEIAVDDPQSLHEALMAEERKRDAAAEVAEKHPEQAALVTAGDARTKEGAAQAGAKDAATRKRKERARTLLASAISAALAAAIALLWFRGPGMPRPGLPAGGYATLADAVHDLARKSCSAQQWVTCLEDLDQLKHLDASKVGPAEQAAWSAAVAGVRQQALAACTDGDYMACVEGLDIARRYDAAGESDPRVQLARSEAQQKLRGTGAPAPSWNPDAKEIPRQHR